MPEKPPIREDSSLYYEEIGDSFDEWMSDYDVSRRIHLIRDLLPSLTGDEQALEVGCGTGRISSALQPQLPNLLVTDVSASLAEQVGTRLGLSWAGADACVLGLDANQFDVVFSSECIEHTPDPTPSAQGNGTRVQARRLGAGHVTKPRLVPGAVDDIEAWYPQVSGAGELALSVASRSDF